VKTKTNKTLAELRNIKPERVKYFQDALQTICNVACDVAIGCAVHNYDCPASVDWEEVIADTISELKYNVIKPAEMAKIDSAILIKVGARVAQIVSEDYVETVMCELAQLENHK